MTPGVGTIIECRCSESKEGEVNEVKIRCSKDTPIGEDWTSLEMHDSITAVTPDAIWCGWVWVVTQRRNAFGASPPSDEVQVLIEPPLSNKQRKALARAREAAEKEEAAQAAARRKMKHAKKAEKQRAKRSRDDRKQLEKAVMRAVDTGQECEWVLDDEESELELAALVREMKQLLETIDEPGKQEGVDATVTGAQWFVERFGNLMEIFPVKALNQKMKEVRGSRSWRMKTCHDDSIYSEEESDTELTQYL